jgi:hypothetical protein
LTHKFSHFCAVCGDALDHEGGPYLLTAQPATNRIAILRWNSALAKIEGVRAACSQEHVLEVVAHWMVSGQLDLTFTQTALDADRQASDNEKSSVAQNPRLGRRSKPVCEIVINRDSVRKLVASDPEALASVLDTLLEALQRDVNSTPAKRPQPENATTRHTSVA